ncbi:hypothetical protein AVEN_173748-1, partial [Araneus ventricosus]
FRNHSDLARSRSMYLSGSHCDNSCDNPESYQPSPASTPTIPASLSGGFLPTYWWCNPHPSQTQR